MNPVNQEHKEAEQFAADKVREDFVKSLPKDAQDKFAAVQQAVEILVKANLKFYLFPMLPHGNNKDKDTVWQWNSMIANLKYDELGKPTKESSEENASYHAALFYQFFNLFKGSSGKKTYSDAMSVWGDVFHANYVKHYEYLYGKIENK